MAVLTRLAAGDSHIVVVDADPNDAPAVHEPISSIALLFGSYGGIWLSMGGGVWEPIGGGMSNPEWAAAFLGAVMGRSATHVYVMGRRISGWSSTSAYGDIAEYLDVSQADVNVPTIGTPYYLYSSSAQDGPAGTGARKVRVVSIDGGALQSNEYAMNGTTKVAIGSAHAYFQWMEVSELGTAFGTAAGDISITSDGTAAPPTVANTYEYIKAGGNRSMSCRFKVPVGHTFYLLDWGCHALNADMDVRLRADVFAYDRSLSPGIFHFQDNAYLANDTGNPEMGSHYLKFPAGAVIKASAIPGLAPAGNRADASIHGILVAD